MKYFSFISGLIKSTSIQALPREGRCIPPQREAGKKGKWIILLVLSFMISHATFSQAERKFIRQGNREYDKDNYSESEISYRKAIDKNNQSPDAVFNTGDALYRQKKYEDAGKQFIGSHNMNEDRNKKSASLFNLGNSMLMANKIQESIEAYKGSLKLDPRNMEAKYNLAYAQDLLKQQQQQQQQQQQDKQDKNQNKEDQNKDEKKNQQDKQDQDNNQDKQNNQQQQKQQEQQISKEDAERVLNALANDEKKVQEKVKLAKALKARVRTLKNW